MNKRTRDLLITGGVIVLAIFVTMRFGRSLPDNQPDRDETIKSLIGDWAVTGVTEDGVAFEFPDVLPSLIFDSNTSWRSVTECATFEGTATFDGVNPIAPDSTGVIGFEPEDVEGLTTIGCDDVETVVRAMVAVDSWEWRGGDMRVYSQSGDVEFTISPVL